MGTIDQGSEKDRYMALPRIIDTVEFELEPVQLNNVEFKLSGKLFCPPPTPLNIHLEKIHQENITWLKEIGLLTDKISHQFEAARLEGIVASTIRNIKIEDMKLIINLISTFVIFDDVAEKFLSEKNNLPKFKSVISTVNDIFQGKYLTVNNISNTKGFPFLPSFYRAFFDLFKRVYMSYQKPHYFIKSIENFFHGLLMMEILRENTTISIQTYLTARKFIYGMSIAYELTYIAMGLNIDANIRTNPTFLLLTEKALNLLLLLNDIVSLPNETNSNCLDNYILMKASRSKSNDLKKAFAHTVKLFNDELYDFLAMNKLITDEITNSYYHSILIPSVRDAIDWSFKYTKRYGKITAEFKQENLPNNPKNSLANLSFFANSQIALQKSDIESIQLNFSSSTR